MFRGDDRRDVGAVVAAAGAGHSLVLHAVVVGKCLHCGSLLLDAATAIHDSLARVALVLSACSLCESARSDLRSGLLAGTVRPRVLETVVVFQHQVFCQTAIDWLRLVFK